MTLSLPKSRNTKIFVAAALTLGVTAISFFLLGSLNNSSSEDSTPTVDTNRPAQAPLETEVETAASLPPSVRTTKPADLPKGDATLVGVATGDDWSVSPTASRADNSGLYWIPKNMLKSKAADIYGVSEDSYSQPRYAYFIDVSWSELNPSEGSYDWSPLDKELAEIEGNSGLGFSMFLRTYGANMPSWVDAKGGFRKGSNAWKERSGDKYILNEAMRPFMNAFAERYGNNEQLVAIEMRNPADNSYGEWSFSEKSAECEPWAKAFHQEWHDAMKKAGANPSKLVMMTAQESCGGASVLDNGYKLGLGQRDGIPIRNFIWRDAYGIYIDDDSYVQIDESHPKFASGGISMSENTEHYFHEDIWGPREHSYHTMRVALFWNLKINRNWLSFPSNMFTEPGKGLDGSLKGPLHTDYKKAQAMIKWSEFQLGQTVETTAEAYVDLRQRTHEGTNLNGSGPATAKNMGRWLEQKDVPTGQTKPAFKIDATNMDSKWYWPLDEDAEYWARQTDIAGGNPNMFFEVDDRFFDQTSTQLKVVFKNDVNTSFHIEYDNGEELARTPSVKTDSAGDWQTATFEFPRMSQSTKYQGMDFKLVNDGASDLTVNFVRLLDITS